MLILKPLDNGSTRPSSRSGHGAASVIPHLRERGPLESSELSDSSAGEAKPERQSGDKEQDSQSPEVRLTG